MHALLFTAYGVLLSKFTGQDDLIIGIPVNGRRHPELRRVFGMFAGILPIRITLDGKGSFAEWVQNSMAILNKAIEHRDLAFDELLQLLPVGSNPGRNPVFDTMFLHQTETVSKLATKDFKASRYLFDPGFAKFDLTLEIVEENEAIHYSFEYSTALFKKETIYRLGAGLENIIKLAMTRPEITVAELLPITDREHTDLVVGYNQTEKDYLPFKAVHEMFAMQAAEQPAAVALSCAGKQMTYEALNHQSSAVARALGKRGVGRNDIVAVCLPNSFELVVSILGILKAGAAYLPIDEDMPVDRIGFMLNDSKSKLFISQAALWKDDAAMKPDFVILSVEDLLDNADSEVAEHAGTPSGLAYVIYTSGTTGRPKGVMIEHGSLSNYVNWAREQYLEGAGCAMPLYTSVSFDLTITSIFLPLVSGGKIVIYDKSGAESLIEKVMRENQVDLVKLTPSHLKLMQKKNLLRPGTKIKKFIVGGEALDKQLASDAWRLMGRNVQIYNEYGPTEATVGCMIHAFSPEDLDQSVPIGRPIANVQIYLLDPYLKPVPTLVTGEIYVAGTALARGYLFQHELTRKTFVDNPFNAGQKMYKTGDLAKRLPDGNLVYLGRKDHQVKLNGYRIEIAEIEARLMEFPGVDQCAVAVDAKSRMLSAYYTKKTDRAITERELRVFLAAKLPHYMIPVRLIPLDAFPLTANGKLDLNRLEIFESRPAQWVDEESATETESVFVNVWKGILGGKPVSLHDNFFELGGDSIKAVQISSKLFEKGISVKVKDILIHQTIRQISRHAKHLDGTAQYEQGMVEGKVTPTPIQRWFFRQQFSNPNYYNQSVLLQIKSPLDVAALESAFAVLVGHHDALRLNLDPEDNTLFYNTAHIGKGFRVDQLEVGDERSLGKACDHVRRSVNLSEGLLLKAAIMKRAEGPDFLFITAHHLIMDGMSWRILLRDLYDVYFQLKNNQDVKLPRKTASFRDWSEALSQYAKSEQVRRESEYWNKLQEIHFVLPNGNAAGCQEALQRVSRVGVVLDKNVTHFLLHNAHKQYNADVLILLNAALVSALHNWTGGEEFVIEQESHGRHLEEVNASRTIGWFTNLYPVRLFYYNQVSELIQSVKETIRKVPGNGVGYWLNRFTENSTHPKPPPSEVRLNYLGQFGEELNNELMALSFMAAGTEVDPINEPTAKLELNAWVVGDAFRIELNYDAKIFPQSAVSGFLSRFTHALNQIATHIADETELHFTPSDFENVNLDQEELNDLFL